MSERRPAVLVASVGLPVALLVGVIVAANVAQREDPPQPIDVASIPTPAGDSAACTDLAAALPDSVGPFQRADIADPVPPATYAWHRPTSDESVILRCGIDQPLEFVVGSSLQSVDGVQWFEATGAAFTIGSATYVAVDRDVYIALSVPRSVGPTPLQTISDVVADVLPAVAPKPFPLPGS